MRTLGAAYFDQMYAADPDPWQFSSSRYEAEKYADTVAALAQNYTSALEVGCSIGVLTALLAPRCTRLLAIDLAPAAIAQARIRCASLPQVHFGLSKLPTAAPAGAFDLIVLSEVGYYWSNDDLRIAKDQLIGSCLPDAQLLLVHWTPAVESYPQSGDAVHDAFLADPRLLHLHGHRLPKYRLDLFEIAHAR